MALSPSEAESCELSAAEGEIDRELSKGRRTVSAGHIRPRLIQRLIQTYCGVGWRVVHREGGGGHGPALMFSSIGGQPAPNQEDRNQ